MKELFKRTEIYFLLLSNVTASIGVGIAMIAVPWFLVNGDEGSKVYGILAFVVNMILFVVTPFLGVFIDRISRKSMLIILRLVFLLGLVALYLASNWGVSQQWILIGYFGIGSFFFALDFSARSAFVQETFPKNQYQWVNSLLEIETQSAAMLTGAVAALLLDHVGLGHIILGNFVALVISTLSIAAIAYTPKFLESKVAATVIEDFVQGLNYLKDRPMYTVFLVASFVPYVCLIVGNYLIPVLLVEELNGKASDLASYEVIFAIGAIISGVLVPHMVKRWNYLPSIFFCMGMFTLATLMQAIFPSIATIVWTSLFLGYANGAIRIARNSWMMELTEKHIAGRIMSVIPSLMLGARAVLIGVATLIVTYATAIHALWFLSAVLAVSLLVAYLSATRVEVKRFQMA